MTALRNRGATRAMRTAALGVVLAVSGQPAWATSWTGATSDVWTTAGNWNGGVPTTSVDAVFNDTGINTNQSIYVSTTARNAATLNFVSTGTTAILGGLSTNAGGTGRIILSNSTATGGITVNSGAGAVTIGQTGRAVTLELAASQTFLNLDFCTF